MVGERKEFRRLADPWTARETIAQLAIAPGIESVPLEACHGRVVAERIDAALDVPGFDRATMDGFAVRSRDVIGANEADPVVLDVVAEVHAGTRPDRTLGANEAIEISTGAVIPDGADAVVMVERTREQEKTVAIETAVAPGENIMTAGSDIAAGNRVIGPGHQLSTRDISLLAALGNEEVTVTKRPRVAIISTGDELVRPGETLDHQRGQIYDVNSHTLVAAIEAAGGEAILYPHVGDRYDEMETALIDAAETCDIVCSSGSTSASAVDVIYRVVEERGIIHHHGVAVKPGKPMIIGEMGEDAAAYIGLPGYPVSAVMTFRRFVAPRIREAAGLPPENAPTMRATMQAEERFDEGRMRLLPVGIIETGTGDIVTYPVDKGSGATTSLAHADGVVEVPAETAFVADGEAVTVHLFDHNVRPPRVLIAGEDDPLLSRVLDTLGETRYLSVAPREALRRLDHGIPDIAVVGGIDLPSDSEILGTWERTWGLILGPAASSDITSVESLIGLDGTFANVSESALRSALDDHINAIATDRNQPLAELTHQIPGYGMGRPGHQSAARRVKRGEATVGVGLAATAVKLDLEFIPCDTQRIHVVGARDRLEKPGVSDLSTVLADDLESYIDEFSGYTSQCARQ